MLTYVNLITVFYYHCSWFHVVTFNIKTNQPILILVFNNIFTIKIRNGSCLEKTNETVNIQNGQHLSFMIYITWLNLILR